MFEGNARPERRRPSREPGGALRGGAALCTSLVLLVAVLRGTSASEPEVHVHIFLSQTCPHCELVKEDSLGRLSERLGCQIVPHYYDVDSLDEYKRLVILERRLGDTGNDLPTVVLGTHVLGGTAEVTANLEKLITGYRETGLPPVQVPSAQEADAELKAAVAGARAAGAAVRLAYFEEPGCRQCARAERVLALAKARVPGLEVRRFDVGVRADSALLEVLCERAAVPPGRRQIVPAVFVATKALVREQISDDALDKLLVGPANDRSAAVWEATPEELAAAERRLWERARAVSLAAVVAGGLVDGVNPCAFATLVFFVCCLSGAGTNRRLILAMGVFFTLGVMITYFVTGVGLSEGLRRLDMFPSVSRMLTWLIIAGTFALAAVSFWDFVTALRGRAGEMKLKLPDRLRLRINAIIARRLRARSVALGALGVGATVSLLEFACTGQVYFPLIRLMTQVSATRLRGLGLLALYNLAFAVPLMVVFLATYFGLSSERLVASLRRHVASAKLLLAVFFLGLAALLLCIELGRMS